MVGAQLAGQPMTATADVTGHVLARALVNVNAFVPAKTRCPAVRVRIGYGAVFLAACDGYTVGTEHLRVKTSGQAEAYLTRDAAKELESVARGEKKNPLSLVIGEQVTLNDKFGDYIFPVTTDPDIADMLSFADDLLERLSRRDVNTAECVAFQPELFARFSKVKPLDGSVPIMDMRLNGPNHPAQIKIGETFLGAIMPIHRDYAPEGTLF